MKINELQDHLDTIGPNQSEHSIGAEADDRLVIMEIFGRDKWQISYTERGQSLEYKTLQDEADVCAYLLQQLNPTTFQPKIE